MTSESEQTRPAIAGHSPEARQRCRASSFDFSCLRQGIGQYRNPLLLPSRLQIAPTPHLAVGAACSRHGAAQTSAAVAVAIANHSHSRFAVEAACSRDGAAPTSAVAAICALPFFTHFEVFRPLKLGTATPSQGSWRPPRRRRWRAPRPPGCARAARASASADPRRSGASGSWDRAGARQSADSVDRDR